MIVKRLAVTTFHSPEWLAWLCRSRGVQRSNRCICGVLDCPLGEDVECGNVEPWMWKKIMEDMPDGEEN